jgi:GGDEF-like domain
VNWTPASAVSHGEWVSGLAEAHACVSESTAGDRYGQQVPGAHRPARRHPPDGERTRDRRRQLGLVVSAVSGGPHSSREATEAASIAIARAGLSEGTLVVVRQGEIVAVPVLGTATDPVTLCERIEALQERLKGEGKPLAVGVSTVAAGVVELSRAYLEARAPRASASPAAFSARPCRRSRAPTSTSAPQRSSCTCTRTPRSTACIESSSGRGEIRDGSQICSISWWRSRSSAGLRVRSPDAPGRQRHAPVRSRRNSVTRMKRRNGLTAAGTRRCSSSRTISGVTSR